jgi:diamine N-acetyltransferase
MFLKGNKIYLRSLNESDFDKIFSWENNPENWRVSGTENRFTKDEIEQFVKSEQDILIAKQVRLMICDSLTNEAIGAVDIFEYDAKHQRAGIGILIEPSHRKNGFGNEALILASAYALNEIGLRNLFASIFSDNAPSILLFEKAGFKKIGHKIKSFSDNGKWIDELLYQMELIQRT